MFQPVALSVSLPYLPSMPLLPMSLPQAFKKVCNADTALVVSLPYLPSTAIVPPIIFLNDCHAVVVAKEGCWL